MQQRWKASGIPDLYEGRDGPVSRERARNVRCVFYPKPDLPHGTIENITIPGPGGVIPVRIIRPLAGEPTGTLVFFHGGGFIWATSTPTRPMPSVWPTGRAWWWCMWITA